MVKTIVVAASWSPTFATLSAAITWAISALKINVALAEQVFGTTATKSCADDRFVMKRRSRFHEGLVTMLT